MKKRKKEKQKQFSKFIKIDKRNYEFLKMICSRSGISWHELYYVNSNRYFTCLQIYDFMKNSYRSFFKSIMFMENTLVTCDVEHMRKADYLNRFDNILKKFDNEQMESKKYSRIKKSLENQKEIMSFDSELKYNKDEVKLMTLRVYLFAKDKEELQDRLDKLINKLSILEMQGYIQTNNLVDDYKALTMLDNPVRKMVASTTIAEYLMKSEINRIDECGGYIGYTVSGNYAPDFYSFENYSFDKFVMAGRGGGKSALVKLMEEVNLNRLDHIVYLFDVHNEYDEYAKENEIESVSVNEENNINLMQIFAVDNDNHVDIIRENDIETQISLIVSKFATINKVEREQTMTQLELHLKELYLPYKNKRLSNFHNEDWFLLEDVLELIQEKKNNNEYEEIEKEDIYNLELGLKKMIYNYGYLFNRKTNMEFDLSKSLRFDFSFLRDNQNKKLKTSYVSLLMSYVNKGLFENGQYNNQKAKEDNKNIYELKRPYRTLSIVVDETAQYLDKTFLNNALNGLKLARKCYGGYTFIFHSINDIQKSESECGSELRELFELCTNKIIGICDADSINELPNYISGLTKRDMNIIANFKKGEHGERRYFIIDDKKRKTIFTSVVTKNQRKYFKGGV